MAKKQPYNPARISTAERRAQAPDGVYDEQLSCNRGHVRERVALPMTLLPALYDQLVSQLHAKRTGTRPNDPPLRKTKLDKALDHDETQSLRWALSRYVCDVLETQESGAGGEGGARHPSSDVPFGRSRQAALGRVAYIHTRARYSSEPMLSERWQLDQFAVMMGARHPRLLPLSMAQFGRQLAGLSDERIQEGVAVGRVLGLAATLHELYRAMPQTQALD